MRFIFLDLETTGLEAGVDQITEAAWITDDGAEYQAFVQHDRFPSAWVAKNTDYGSRILPADKVKLSKVLFDLRCAVWGLQGNNKDESVHIVGACPAFDDRFLRHAFACEESEVPYHYHVIDVEAMAFGALGLETMPSLKDLRAALGILGENDAPHTALADAREVKLIFEAIRRRAKVAVG